MRAGKAYISSLGTTGVLIASSFLLLTVVGALVAFDRWPSQAVAEPETVAIAEPAERARTTGASTAGAAALAPRALQRAGTTASAPTATARAAAGIATGTGLVESGAATAQIPAADPVVATQPAPDAGPAPAAGNPDPAPAPTAVPGRPEPSAPGRGPDLPSLDPLLPGEGSAPGPEALAGTTGAVDEKAMEIRALLGTALEGDLIDTRTRR